MALQRAIVCMRAMGLAVLAGFVLCGCATPALDAARHDFYAGQYDKADKALESAKMPDKDRVLLLMERGTIREASGNYDDSSRDFIAASDLLDQFETYSLSKGTASWVVNDTVENFRGAPFERTLLHVFTAHDHLALGHWDDAAVEARRIIKSLDPSVRGNYPEDAFSRYVAGFCLEMIDDTANAELQYREATRLLRGLKVDEATGHIAVVPVSTNGEAAVEDSSTETPWQSELVCFILAGRSPRGEDTLNDRWMMESEPVYAEIYSKDMYLGRSYNLADTVDLAFATDRMEAARKAAKTIGRVVVKEGISEQVEKQNEALGELLRFVLIGLLERPDIRRWETLPRWLQVARVPCPSALDEYQVRLVGPYGTAVRTATVRNPITRRGNIFFSLWRDTAPPL
jgi:uncharacterized protein